MFRDFWKTEYATKCLRGLYHEEQSFEYKGGGSVKYHYYLEESTLADT